MQVLYVLVYVLYLILVWFFVCCKDIIVALQHCSITIHRLRTWSAAVWSEEVLLEQLCKYLGVPAPKEPFIVRYLKRNLTLSIKMKTLRFLTLFVVISFGLNESALKTHKAICCSDFPTNETFELSSHQRKPIPVPVKVQVVLYVYRYPICFCNFLWQNSS